jgi:repressor LexA
MKKVNKNLTSRQEEGLEFIRSYIQEQGAPPTLREIADGLGISSSNGARSLVEVLERKGVLERRPGLSRGLVITDGVESEDMRGIRKVPILGQVAAGAPILAEENLEGYVRVDEELIGAQNHSFALTVKGDSMINAGIFDGDTVIARLQATAVTGDLVVAILDDEATVKFFFPDSEKVRLEPANPNYEPIMVDLRSTPFRIAGKVTALVRKM